MPEPLKEKTSPYLRIVGIAMLVNFLGPLLIWFITGGSITAAIFALSITNALLGLAFLLLCLPLGEVMDRVQRGMPLAVVGKIMDVVLRHTFILFGWPQSRFGWRVTLVALAGIFLFAAVSSFFCAIGDMQSDKALTDWVEHTSKPCSDTKDRRRTRSFSALGRSGTSELLGGWMRCSVLIFP